MRRCGIVVAALLMFGCGGSRFDGFKEVADGTYLRYHRLGEGDALADDADSVLLRVRFAAMGEEPGSLYSTERWYAASDLRDGALRPVLRRIHEGDSMSVIAAQHRWPWGVLAGNAVPPLADTTTLRAELCLLRIRTPEQMRVQREARRRADPISFERALIEARVASDSGRWTRWGTSDMHFEVRGSATDTQAVVLGELVTVAWSGVDLITGRRIDAQEAFTWRYGDPDQVIAGMQTAVSLMRLGQEGSFILPSSMAFADRGLSGLVEPWTPVIYEVRITSIAGRAPNQ